MNNLNLADLTCEPIIAKKAQDANNIGVCQYSANQLLQSITPENMVTGIQRLFNIRNYEDNFLTSWQDDYNNLNKLSEVITAMVRDNSRYNGKFSYNKNGLATVGLVHYLSKNQQDREQDTEIDNNPLTDNGVHWFRGIKDTDLLSQRFNLWNVSINNRTITLTSTTEFSDYLFTADQLKDGLEISFIPTQDGVGYSAGQGYTLIIDGVSKKLFEIEDETIAGTGSSIKAGKLLKIYYKQSGNSGAGAWYIVNTSISTTYLGILNISNVDDDNLTFRITSPDTHIQSILNNINAQNIFRYYFDLSGLVNKKILSTQQDPNGTCWKAIFNDNFSCNVFFNYTTKYNTNDWAGLGIYLSNSLNRAKRFFYASFGNYTGLFLQDTFRQKLLIYQNYRSYTNPAGSASGSPNAVEAVNTFIYSTGLMEVKLYLSRGGNFDTQNITHKFPIPFVNNDYNINITPGVLGAGSLAPSAGYSNVTTTSFQSNVSEANLNRMSINLSGEVDLDTVL